MYGAKALAFLKYTGGAFSGSIAKVISEEEKEALAAICENEKARLESALTDAESKHEELTSRNDKLKDELDELYAILDKAAGRGE